ncbi:hypothetical protein SO802_025111 [Lithocarpus litseifolius]|uniref:Uncharacterized protein n=1 Tax=Lithocarpus litseifolius TaxID=425828 RepID=A0AAW2BW77_9ROSI
MKKLSITDVMTCEEGSWGPGRVHSSGSEGKMNNEAIAARLSRYLPLSDRGANNPSTNLSFYLEFLIFDASGAKEVGNKLLYLP